MLACLKWNWVQLLPFVVLWDDSSSTSTTVIMKHQFLSFVCAPILTLGSDSGIGAWSAAQAFKHIHRITNDNFASLCSGRAKKGQELEDFKNIIVLDLWKTNQPLSTFTFICSSAGQFTSCCFHLIQKRALSVCISIRFVAFLPR